MGMDYVKNDGVEDGQRNLLVGFPNFAPTVGIVLGLYWDNGK